MPKISTDNYDTVASWNGSQDLFIVEQPDGTKVATPAMVKQFIEAGDFEATGEVKDGHGNILADMAKSEDVNNMILSEVVSYTNSTPIASGNYASFMVPATKQGYTPIGIIGVSGSGTGKLSLMEFSLGGGFARIYYMNDTNNSITPTRINVNVLYIKN